MTDDVATLEQILTHKRGETAAVVDVDEPLLKVVIFTLANERFAFAGDRIREILRDGPVFPLPGCPKSLEGVINVRGDIESVIDLRVVLGIGGACDKAASRILLGWGGGMRSGIRVDAVDEVTDIPQSGVQPPPHTVPDDRKAIILGVFTFAARPVTLLDLDRLFEIYRTGLS